MTTLNNNKINKIIKKTDYKNIKSTISLVMYICDIIEKSSSSNGEEKKDKVKLFLDHSEEIAQKLVTANIISSVLVKDLNNYVDIVEDFYELWGKTKKHCKFSC